MKPEQKSGPKRTNSSSVNRACLDDSRPNPVSCLARAIGLLSVLCSAPLAHAVSVSPQEMSESHHWVAAEFETPAGGETPAPPFSFIYGGRPFLELLRDWTCERGAKRLDDQRTERTLTYTDPKTGLEVRCVAIEYHDFPTVEWTLHIKNTGGGETPILENLQALDMRLVRAGKGEFVLHHNRGSQVAPNDYQPLQTVLGAKGTNRFAGAGGVPTAIDLSYFNVEWPGQGVIVVIGWPGQWAAQFTRDAGKGLGIRAGQELTHFKLDAGEAVRTPLIVLQFWKGDWLRAQNVWRRWMLAHNVPRPGGKLPEPELFGCSSHFTGEMTQANEENQIQWINRYVEEGIPIGHWWMDAGWYFNYGGGWTLTGTWEVDTNRFPHGLRAISDYAHSKGIKTIVWFEPEYVRAGTWLAEKHPEWILGGKQGGLLNEGNAGARQWLTDHIDKLMIAQGIDLYREDSGGPLGFWRANDAEDRQGITEIKHVEGHLAYWDELRRRHPDMFIDSCAGGGQRNDLETMRRAIPLWRTDCRCEPVGTQCHTYGISFWIPLSGTGAADVNSYVFRSNMAPFSNCLWDMRDKKLDYGLMRRLTGEFARIAPCWLGDYYPLTPYSTGHDAWMAWQFDVPEKGEGLIQAFRRDESPFYGLRLKLQGLDAAAEYALTDLDVHQKPKEHTGRQLMEQGLSVDIPDQPGAVVITYKKLK